MLLEMVRATKWFAILNIATMVRASSDAPIVKHPRIINAQGEGWYLYKPFVSLLDRTGETYCSGVVIGDHEILTAAHCLQDLVPLVARFNDDAPDMDLDPSMYNVNPGYVSGEEVDWNYDTGVIVTSKKIPKSAGRGRIIDTPAEYDTTVFAFGVGDTVEDATEWWKITEMSSDRSFGDFVDWVVDGVSDAVDWVGDAVGDTVDWVGDTIFGDDEYSGEYDGEYSGEYVGEYSGEYDGEYSGEYDGEYSGEYDEYDDLIEGENTILTSDVPRVASMVFARDTSCIFLSDGGTYPGLICTWSDSQNTCNGDSGGPVVTPDGYVIGLTSLGSPGCDKFPEGLYESIATDLTWSGNRDFIERIAGKDAYKHNDADPVNFDDVPQVTPTVEPDTYVPVVSSAHMLLTPKAIPTIALILLFGS
jgi:hypothetical protein